MYSAAGQANGLIVWPRSRSGLARFPNYVRSNVLVTPSGLLSQRDLRWAIENGFRAFDFLRGNEAYKASWRAQAIPLVQVRIVGKQPSAKVRYATWRGAQKVKGWARQVLAREKG